jgi:DNA end-binding protein Ku
VLEAIQKKVEGQEIKSDTTAGTGGDKIIDLMEALKASLAKSSAPEEAAPPKAKKQKTA